MKRKYTFAVLVFVVTLAGLWVAQSIPTWTQHITWTYTSQSISVSNTPTKDLGEIIGEETREIVYTVTNDGSATVTVGASAIATGATFSWDKASEILAPGEQTTFTLTLQITGEGSADATLAIQ